MSERTANGFMLSAALHALVAGALFLGYLIGEQAAKNVPHVLELVAGEGDNYEATEAPKLGVPGGIKVEIPEPPAPSPAAPEPTPIRAAPIESAPPPVVQKAPPPVAKPVEKIPDFSKDVKRIATKRQQRLEAKDRRIREAQEKKEREDAARKAREEELNKRRMTKAEFDALTKGKAPPSKSSRSPKVTRIDTEGIAKGVWNGSTANKTGGAGGTALSSQEGDAIDRYTALLARKIKTELDERPGVGAGMVVEVELDILSDGSLTNVRIARSSGSAEFDDAVKDALAKIQMPDRPKGLSQHQRFPIRGVTEE